MASELKVGSISVIPKALGSGTGHNGSLSKTSRLCSKGLLGKGVLNSCSAVVKSHLPGKLTQTEAFADELDVFLKSTVFVKCCSVIRASAPRIAGSRTRKQDVIALFSDYCTQQRRGHEEAFEFPATWGFQSKMCGPPRCKTLFAHNRPFLSAV